MEVAHVLRKRSTCKRGKVGAVAVLDSRIIATGYNGSPAGTPHCTELGCDVPANFHEAGCQRAIHAEANLIAFAARHGATLGGATIFCTHGPCLKCAQLVVSAGIVRFVYGVPYRLTEGMTLIVESGLEVVRMPKEFVLRAEARHEDDKWGQI
jgi:dCMP deaminase